MSGSKAAVELAASGALDGLFAKDRCRRDRADQRWRVHPAWPGDSRKAIERHSVPSDRMTWAVWSSSLIVTPFPATSTSRASNPGDRVTREVEPACYRSSGVRQGTWGRSGSTFFAGSSRAFGADALRAAGPRAPGMRRLRRRSLRAPHRAHANMNGTSPPDEVPHQLAVPTSRLNQAHPRAADPNRIVCTTPPGIKGAQRRSAMASGHP